MPAWGSMGDYRQWQWEQYQAELDQEDEIEYVECFYCGDQILESEVVVIEQKVDVCPLCIEVMGEEEGLYDDELTERVMRDYNTEEKRKQERIIAHKTTS